MYCDFHFSTSTKYKNDLVLAILSEIKHRASELKNKKLKSVYFGGGTPSLLNQNELDQIFECIFSYFEIENDAEITLEANPDDIFEENIKIWKKSPINRLSVGIQSFFEEDLIWMNRAHNAQMAEKSIKLAQDSGFHNISGDLIFAYPLLSDQKWEFNLNKFNDLNINHLSTYSMTLEPKTAYALRVNKGIDLAPPETKSEIQFKFLMDFLEANNWDHYEISNSCKNNQFASHNSSYWKGEDYLGVGPSAHSFIQGIRSSNIANNSLYISGLKGDNEYRNYEELSIYEQFNDFILTGLRTKWGINTSKIHSTFGENFLKTTLKNSEKWINSGHLYFENEILTLSKKGKLLADHISSDLFILE